MKKLLVLFLTALCLVGSTAVFAAEQLRTRDQNKDGSCQNCDGTQDKDKDQDQTRTRL